MHAIKFMFKSFCFLVLLTQWAIRGENHFKKRSTAATIKPQPSMHKINGLNVNDIFFKQQKLKKHHIQQHNYNPLVRAKQPEATKKIEKLHSLNKKLLNKMGFIKVKAPNSHNRKRLAIQSRRYTSSHDSHMFIIKLPPNMYYYTNPEIPDTYIGKNTGPSNSKTAQNGEEVPNTNQKKLSTFPFNSNGKPLGIYHWNLPVIKKIFDNKQRIKELNTKRNQLLDLKSVLSLAKSLDNETIEKPYNRRFETLLKHKSPSYYAPAIAVNKSGFNKYFSGNGKLTGFFVIKENQSSKYD